METTIMDNAESKSAELDKNIKEWEKDVGEFYDAFKKFSFKYGHQISGFTLIKGKDSCWSIVVMANGELFC